MKTIRTKLAVIFILFMISLILFGIILNALFLEKYYIYRNRDIFIETNSKILDEYIYNKKNIENYIDSIDRMEGISCIITDRKFEKIIYDSFPQKSTDGMRIPNDIMQLVIQNRNKLLKTYVYTVIEIPSDQSAVLVFISRMDSGELIILRKPLKGIAESVSIANQFYVFAGLVLIFIGGLFIFFFSKTITKPIIEMSNVAEGISNLEFNKYVDYDSQDEIGSLGKSINKISEKLSASLNALKQDVERRKQLVRNISHELKTPIGVIKGYAEGLKYGVAEDRQKTIKYCNVIAEECNRMDNMVRELLDLSMLESGMFQLNMATVNLTELIEKISERFNPIFKEKGITINSSIEKNMTMYADYELLERVINNYIINAINHIGGARLIRINTEIKSNRIKVSVFNTGNHIPDADIENIWDVFYKVDKARSRQYGGHGLGLPITRLIAQLHGGITGSENVDQGVLFFIEIPLK